MERETGIEPAPSAWKAEVLPLNYSRAVTAEASCRVGTTGGGRWIRTTEGVSQQIYSLPPLAAWVSLRSFARHSPAQTGSSRKPVKQPAILTGRRFHVNGREGFPSIRRPPRDARRRIGRNFARQRERLVRVQGHMRHAIFADPAVRHAPVLNGMPWPSAARRCRCPPGDPLSITAFPAWPGFFLADHRTHISWAAETRMQARPASARYRAPGIGIGPDAHAQPSEKPSPGGVFRARAWLRR